MVPVYNEAGTIERSVRRLHAFLSTEFPFAWRIVIADNASTDSTPSLARQLAFELTQVTVLRLEAKGRGRALRAAWSASDADVLAYMDVDLSTDLKGLLPLVAGLVSGHSDVAIGTRLAPGSRVRRGPKREFISRSYNRILRLTLGARFSDAQCGFKAIRAQAARTLLPEIEDQGWFFDTELLILAQRRGLRIHEVAVDWTDDPDSRVDIVSTALTDLRGVLRLRMATPVARFALIGVASTVVLRRSLPASAWRPRGRTRQCAGAGYHRGRQHPGQPPFTFGVRGRAGLARQHAAGGLVYLLALGLTGGALERPARARPAALVPARGDSPRGGQRLRDGQPLHRIARLGFRGAGARPAPARSPDLKAFLIQPLTGRRHRRLAEAAGGWRLAGAAATGGWRGPPVVGGWQGPPVVGGWQRFGAPGPPNCCQLAATACR